MTSLRATAALVAVTTALGIAACGSDKPQKNPSFTTGAAGSPAGGAPTTSTVAGAAGESTSGLGTIGTPDQTTAGNGAGGAAGSPTEVGGAAGAGPEVPPYDCVLHPVTHLEIINACTDAGRIEKHPKLPALPQ